MTQFIAPSAGNLAFISTGSGLAQPNLFVDAVAPNPSASAAISGVAATGSHGSITASVTSQPLLGTQASGGTNTIAFSVANDLVGAQSSGFVGLVTPSIKSQLRLGTQAAGLAVTLTPTSLGHLAGVSATGAATTESGKIGSPVLGIAATGSASSGLTSAVLGPSVGCAANSAVGAFTGAQTASLGSAIAVASSGTVTATNVNSLASISSLKLSASASAEQTNALASVSSVKLSLSATMSGAAPIITTPPAVAPIVSTGGMFGGGTLPRRSQPSRDTIVRVRVRLDDEPEELKEYRYKAIARPVTSVRLPATEERVVPTVCMGAITQTLWRPKPN